MSDFEFEGGSDQEVSTNHSKLIESVTQLDKGQRVRKAERSEPSLQVSEFHLVQSGVSDGNAVRLQDLAKTLGKRSSHGNIAKKLAATEKKSKTLPKPLEKPAAARIKRSVGFDNVKDELGKWDAIVAKNRTADQLHFPLKQTDMRLESSNEFLKRFKVQSELEIALAALEPEKKAEKVEEKAEKLSLEQIMERRRDAAKLRAQQSYKEAKAHRQNKIKSKKFHRIERKQKVKAQLKEFEQLQKSDPEAALAKLELLEKSRAEERMSLRHKSTGQWAKNKQIRAKYDKESRQVLAQQLSISRELTQKIQEEDEDEDEDEDDSVPKPLSNGDKENPWTNESKNQSEIDEFVSGYRKYWDEKNAKEKENGDGKIAETFEVPKVVDLPPHLNPVEEIIVEHADHIFSDEESDEAENEKKKRKLSQTKDKKGSKKGRRTGEAVGTSAWLVTSSLEGRETKNDKIEDIDEIFDALTVQKNEKFTEKLEDLKKSVIGGKNREGKKSVGESKEYEPDLGFKNQKLKPVIDEELGETAERNISDYNNEIDKLKKISTADTRISTKPTEAEIDPNKFINIKPKHLKTQIPDVVTTGDEGIDDNSDDEDEEKHKLISEAFADDDVVEEFRKEKADEVKKSLPENLDLNLPGWGSWGGKNVVVSKRKKRRFILKFPKDGRRKDQNKGDVIIIEEKDPKIKEHQVNELPFPFNSVKDFEASVRAPIGRTFVPENAHRRLIEPAVKTKLGKIIEPMDQEALVDTKKMNSDKVNKSTKKLTTKKRGKKSMNKT